MYRIASWTFWKSLYDLPLLKMQLTNDIDVINMDFDISSLDLLKILTLVPDLTIMKEKFTGNPCLHVYRKNIVKIFFFFQEPLAPWGSGLE
jgi:hypothetical protein